MTQEDSIALETAKLQLEKLRDEVATLRRAWWKTPAIWASLGAFAISLFANLVQYNNSRSENARKDSEFQLKYQQAQAELDKLKDDRVRADQLVLQTTAAAKRNETENAALRDELSQVEANIRVWEDAIASDNIARIKLAGEVTKYEIEKRPIPLEGAKKNLESQDVMIAEKKSQLKESKERRTELQNLLRR